MVGLVGPSATSGEEKRSKWSLTAPPAVLLTLSSITQTELKRKKEGKDNKPDSLRSEGKESGGGEGPS